MARGRPLRRHNPRMKILILGAGRVGESAAESLVSERNDITVIDTDPVRLRALQERLDLRTVTGNGIQPSLLLDAGADDADMLIACAAQDETNLVVCKVADSDASRAEAGATRSDACFKGVQCSVTSPPLGGTSTTSSYQ